MGLILELFLGGFLTVSYWNNLMDFSQSKVGITLSAPNGLGISFGFQDKLQYFSCRRFAIFSQ